MNNVIEFVVAGNDLIGLVRVSTTATHYIGKQPIDCGGGRGGGPDLTGALREFNLPNAVAPGDWPNPDRACWGHD